MDIRHYNRGAWDRQVDSGNEWTIPVSSEVIAAARNGEWQVVLTETKPVPRAWFPDLTALDVLCLASGGGQQGPVLSAAGAKVTVLDNSPIQLKQDRLVAEREKLDLTTVEGDMADLSIFGDESFDLVFHPCSNLFVLSVRPVWKEAFRVLRRGGVLLSGFLNPVVYIFDRALADRGALEVRHTLPYGDLTSLDQRELDGYLAGGDPLEFSHTLEDQIGGQLDAGFVLAGLYEDRHREFVLAKYTATYIATRAVKP
jgi:SAM-dependent methyltransferase